MIFRNNLNNSLFEDNKLFFCLNYFKKIFYKISNRGYSHDYQKQNGTIIAEYRCQNNGQYCNKAASSTNSNLFFPQHNVFIRRKSSY